MKAAFLTGIRQVELRDVPEPKIENDDDVLLRIDVVGVCGSDMHYYKDGQIGAQVVEFPWVVGHECAATVVESGPASKLEPGRRVAVDPLINCTECDQCKSGRIHTCRKQKFLGCPGQVAGSLSEYLVLPERCLFPVPDEVTDDQAVLVEPFSIAMWAQHLAGSTEGKNIAILGAGPIGLSVLAACKAAGDCTVYQTDLLDNRVELAKRMGADWAANAGEIDVLQTFSREMSLGFDIIFECAGQPETVDQGTIALRPGGKLMLVGINENSRTCFDMNYVRRHELTLQPVRRQNDMVQPAIELVASGQVDLDPMVSHHFTLDQTNEAFEIVADYKDNAVKAMIQI
ncbi:MAG: zinc-dependent alcohol dehydrogenase [Phycisphaerae bacterium]